MFTGIVSAVGRIVDVQPYEQDGQREAGVRVRVEVRDFLRDSTRLGDSIAIQGACMTVVDMTADSFTVDVSRESLDCTVGLATPGEVNLEHALRMGDSLDGHLVSGHVDGVGVVTAFSPVGESWDLRIDVPRELSPYLAYKGSITVNGVSLTVNDVRDHDRGCEIRINLIPHTVQVTTLKHLVAGAKVNLEIDMIARYVERMVRKQQIGG
ncbi:riboflavin synthase [Parapusillimonas sp. SGNA-6]|nr:riboflavin synthase [Parapusillimonas sp. SGNA-6]